jgi:excisionase family DNA binding protein
VTKTRRTSQRKRRATREAFNALPILRLEISEAARMLRMSRAQLYKRIRERVITPHKDGARTYITRGELQRYVESCALNSDAVPARAKTPHRRR